MPEPDPVRAVGVDPCGPGSVSNWSIAGVVPVCDGVSGLACFSVDTGTRTVPGGTGFGSLGRATLSLAPEKNPNFDRTRDKKPGFFFLNSLMTSPYEQTDANLPVLCQCKNHFLIFTVAQDIEQCRLRFALDQHCQNGLDTVRRGNCLSASCFCQQDVTCL